MDTHLFGTKDKKYPTATRSQIMLSNTPLPITTISSLPSHLIHCEVFVMVEQRLSLGVGVQWIAKSKNCCIRLHRRWGRDDERVLARSSASDQRAITADAVTRGAHQLMLHSTHE